jgi:hypothetical protein
MLTTADTGAGWLFFYLGVGLIAAAVLLFIIIFIEALVLRGLKWGSFRLSFIDSLVINLTSATFGVIFLFISIPLLNRGVGIALLVFLPLTVLIEGGMLTLLKRHPWRKTWVATIAINVVSYALLYVLALVLSRV